MTLDDPAQQRRDLLRRLAAGEIDEATCDRLLADLVAGPGEAASPGRADDLDRFATTGERPPASPDRGEVGGIPSAGPAATDDLDRWETSPAAMPARSHLSPGDTLANLFRLEKPIGAGGMGQVWRAWDLSGDRVVVVKVLPPELQKVPEEMARVKESFHRVHALQHQHICPVYLLGQDDRCGFFLVMKYIEGRTLSAYRSAYVARHGSFPVEEVVRVLKPVAEALDYAHSRQVVHRDVKPQNILVVGDSEDVQVVDFGLAAQIRTTMTRISRMRMDTSGTYPYMAPEQWRGEYQDGRTDQYALAVVAYELLAGHLPFDAPDAELLRLCVLNDPIRPPKNADPPTNRALARALAKKREERFGSCTEFVEGVREMSHDELAAEIARDLAGAIASLNERGDTRHYEEAVWRHRLRLWREAAERGIASGQVLFGLCHDDGIGVALDHAKAAQWHRRAAEQGNAWAQCFLAQCYYDGEGVAQDLAQAVTWHRKAAEQGNAWAQCCLGECYYAGTGVVQDYAVAAKWYRKAADQGNPRAQKQLGNCYYHGQGVAQDDAEALKWYREAAAQGNGSAQNNIGTCYYYGRGVAQDRAEAVMWFRRAAEQGIAVAQISLGNCYCNGEGVPQNYAEAVKWYRMAAEQGNARAQGLLGGCYDQGEGVPQDHAEAVKWYRKAAEQGNASGQFYLGSCFAAGCGVPRDHAEAARWYRKAAVQGNASAQVELAECYERGTGVPMNRDQAVEWYRKAARQGNADAKKALGRLGVDCRPSGEQR